MDGFTLNRLKKMVRQHFEQQATLPTLKDLEAAGFSKEDIKDAVKKKIIDERYVTMTTGAVVKGFKVIED